MAQLYLYQLRSEVMAKPRLRRDLSAQVPSAAVAGDGKRLDSLGAQSGIPSNMLLRVGIRPKTRRREAIGPPVPS